MGPKAQVPQLLDRTEALPQDMLSGSPAKVLSVQIYLRYTGSVSLTDVTLTFQVPAGFDLSQVSFTCLSRKASIQQPSLVPTYFLKRERLKQWRRIKHLPCVCRIA